MEGKAYDQEILFQYVMHFCTVAPATAAETYWEYTLDIDATSGVTYTNKVTTNSPRS
ncbi:MAG TPA: hypothetical protein VKA09_18525 [Nitrososphaeraceae archaeon]|nr:hypothetical protein [Nitrososphaeraceae archaeon]